MIKIIIYLVFLISIICYPARVVPSTHPYHSSESNQEPGLLNCPACTKTIYCGDGAGESHLWKSHINRYKNAYCWDDDSNWLHVNSGTNISNYWFYANSFEIDGGSDVYMNGPEVVEIKKLNRRNTYNIHFGSVNSGKTFRSFYLTNREEEESKIYIDGHPYYKVDQCKRESNSRPNDDKISCVAIYDPPENETRIIKLTSDVDGGRFIMDYGTNKYTPKFTSFSGITEVEFRGPREYDFCSVLNGQKNFTSIFLAEGVKLYLNLCNDSEDKDYTYTYNLLGTTAELKFNQDTKLSIVLSNSDSSLLFEEPTKEYTLTIKDIIIDKYELTLDLKGNYNYSFSAIKLINGGRLKLLNSSTISLSSIYQGSNLVMSETNISANSMIINSPSDKTIEIEGTNINISSYCTDNLVGLKINNTDNSQATVNLTNCLTLSTIYKGLKLEILRNDSINNFNYHDPIEVNKIEVDTGMIKFIRETTSSCAIKLINAIGKTSINYENYSGLQITELNFNDSLSFIGSEEKIVYIKGLNYKISTKANIFNDLYIKVSTEIKLYPDSNSNTDTLRLCVPNDKDSTSEMDWTSSIIKKYTIDPFTGQNNTHTLTLRNNSNTLFTSEYGQNIKAIYEIENSSLSWEAIGDIEEVNIKSIESSNINTIKFLDENTKKNIIVENILCDASLDITQMKHRESQLNINNVQIGVKSLKLFIKDDLENNILIDKINLSEQQKTFSIIINDLSQTRNYRNEEIHLINVSNYFIGFALNNKEAKNKTNVNFLPLADADVNVIIKDLDDSFKTKFPLDISFNDMREILVDDILIGLNVTINCTLVNTLQYYFAENKFFKTNLKNQDANIIISVSNNTEEIYIKNLSVNNTNGNEENAETKIYESNIRDIKAIELTNIKNLSFEDKQNIKIYVGSLSVYGTENMNIDTYSEVDFGIIEGE